MDDPLELFRKWFAEAEESGLELPEAMTLATAGADGGPSARTVLLKGLDERGFTFFTNYESRKGRELTENPRAALVFHWAQEPRRQVLVTGTVLKLGDEESEQYFRTRPLGSRLATWASRQSEPIAGREELEKSFAEAADLYDGDPPRPPYWGGYVLEPITIEFWESRPNRLHERLCFTRDGEAWTREQLSP